MDNKIEYERKLCAIVIKEEKERDKQMRDMILGGRNSLLASYVEIVDEIDKLTGQKREEGLIEFRKMMIGHLASHCKFMLGMSQKDNEFFRKEILRLYDFS